MAWAVSSVYLHDTPAARAVLGAAPALAGHVYALDLAAVEQPPVATHPRLLAVRSPVRPRDLALVGEGFDWKPLTGLLAARLGAFRPHLAGPSARLAPPDPPLRWLEDLCARVAAPVLWYMAEAQEGGAEAEVAWVLDWTGPVVYVRRERDVLRVDAAGPAPFAADPLAGGLAHLGVTLDGPWFTPHRPGFAWEREALADR